MFMELKVDNRHQQFIIDTALSIEQEHMNSDMNKFQVKEVFKTLESIMKTEENSVPLALQLSDEFMKKFLHLIYGRRELHWALKKAYARLLPQRELEIKSNGKRQECAKQSKKSIFFLHRRGGSYLYQGIFRRKKKKGGKNWITTAHYYSLKRERLEKIPFYAQP